MLSPAVATIILRITSLQLRRKALTESQQQSWRSLEPDLSQKQGPYKTSLLRYKAQPGAAVGRDLEICPVHVPFFYFHSFIADDHCGFALFIAREREVV